MDNISSPSGNMNIGKHKLNLDQRRECRITGVEEVHSFDENTVLLETVDGMLTLKGSGLHVSRLNLEKGEADVDGMVDSLSYSERGSLAKKGEGLLSRLFS